MNATGYAELLPALRGDDPLEEAVEQVKRNTRAYARRQLTWFRHQLPEGALLAGRRAGRAAELAEEIAALWRSRTVVSRRSAALRGLRARHRAVQGRRGERRR